jgi:uncharacterized membrane protein YdjX (TVP38/TMEM64 family)
VGAALACGVALEIAALGHWIPWQSVSAKMAVMTTVVADHRVLATLVFLCVYVVAALLLCPAQLWIIVAGSVFFGPLEGGLTSWAGAILGALAVFLAAKGAFGDSYLRRAGWLATQIESEFNRDSLLYMLALRWLPVSPYWVANAAPPLLGASLAPFMMVAVVGVLPDVITYSIVGAGLGAVLNTRHMPDLAALSQRFGPGLMMIGVLPLLAIIVRRIMIARKRPPLDAGR